MNESIKNQRHNPSETEGGRKGKVGHGKKPKCLFIGFFISKAMFF